MCDRVHVCACVCVLDVKYVHGQFNCRSFLVLVSFCHGEHFIHLSLILLSYRVPSAKYQAQAVRQSEISALKRLRLAFFQN